MNHESRRWPRGSQPCCATRTRHMDGSCLSREALNRDWASVVSKFPLWFKLQVQKRRKLQIKLPKSEVVPIDVNIFIFKWLMLAGLLFFKSRKNLATPSRLQQNVAILLGFDVLGGGCNPGGKGTHCPSPQVTRWWWLRGNGSFGGVCCCANQVAALSKGCFVLVGTGRTCKSSRRKWRVFLFSSIWHWNCFRSLGAWKSWGTFFWQLFENLFPDILPSSIFKDCSKVWGKKAPAQPSQNLNLTNVREMRCGKSQLVGLWVSC